MQVKDVMTSNPVVVRDDENCQEAVALMCRRRIRHLPVVDASGGLEGVLTDRDARHYLLSGPVMRDLGHVPVKTLLRQARVADVMSAPAFTTAADVDLAEAVRVMRDHRVGSLPVVEGRRLIGILTETDLLRRIVGAEAEEPDVDIVVSYP